jgi:hypothetical protein
MRNDLIGFSVFLAVFLAIGGAFLLLGPQVPIVPHPTFSASR